MSIGVSNSLDRNIKEQWRDKYENDIIYKRNLDEVQVKLNANTKNTSHFNLSCSYNTKILLTL